jgi:hypothetical protein
MNENITCENLKSRLLISASALGAGHLLDEGAVSRYVDCRPPSIGLADSASDRTRLRNPLGLGLMAAGVVAVFGILLIVYEIISTFFQWRFSEEYWQRFARFTTEGSNDYEWLLRRSRRMQRLLGVGGI